MSETPRAAFGIPLVRRQSGHQATQISCTIDETNPRESRICPIYLKPEHSSSSSLPSVMVFPPMLPPIC